MPDTNGQKIEHQRLSSGKAQPTPRTSDEIWLSNPEIIRQFLRVRPDYEQLCTEIEYILRKRIVDQQIEVASINSRAKTLDSFLEKFQRKQYDNPFKELTDLAGVRVVCLYSSDIAKVAEIIRADFLVIEDVDKTNELGVDKFGYGARHFIVRLGKTSSGARYDDLKQLLCEVQVRTVVQDAWAIIQHHMVYKREAQVPTGLQRKLNSLAGTFETIDDQFERIREERDAYLVDIRETAGVPATFLGFELNLDSFKVYLTWAFPGQASNELLPGLIQSILDELLLAGHRRLRDVDRIVKETAGVREAILKKYAHFWQPGGTGTSILEVALALMLTASDMKALLPLSRNQILVIENHRKDLGSAG